MRQLILPLMHYFMLFMTGTLGIVVLTHIHEIFQPSLDDGCKQLRVYMLTSGATGLWKLACLEIALYFDFFHKPKGRGIFLLLFLFLTLHTESCDKMEWHVALLLLMGLFYALLKFIRPRR